MNFLRLQEFDHPNRDIWIEQASKEINRLCPDVVVCHSLGNTLWFHMCNEEVIEGDVEHLLLVAPPSMQCDIEELASFFPVTAPKNLHAKNALLVVSDNDPYMTMQEAKALQQALEIPMETLHNAGHINADSDYGEWQWMLQYIKRLGQK